MSWCLQKDILNLVYLCESFGLKEVAEYWNQVVVINDYQKRRFAMKMISKMFNTIAGKKIAILGYAFKKDTGDTRESPAISVAHYLIEEQAKIHIYDPQVEDDQIRHDFDEYHVLSAGTKFDDYVRIATDPYTCVRNAHSIAVLTEWDQFKSYDYKKMYDSMAKPAFIFDGRNILDHQALKKIGFEVYAIGKPYDSTISME
jgi:UDPglucose 6-dehydrogenase